MLVDLKLTSKTKFHEGDLLIFNSDGVFEPISSDKLLSEQRYKISELEMQMENMKQFLKTYQENMTKLLKGVVDNG